MTSELAPFVAAVLRDRVVEDLQEEVQREKETNKDLKSIQLLSGDGSTVYAQGPIPNGEYGMAGGFRSLQSLLWKVFVSQQHDLPPTLDMLRTLQIRFGGGWFTETPFGAHADPHVVPQFYDQSTNTGHFDVSSLGSSNLKSLGLVVNPIWSVEQYHQVVGAPPGGLFSRLVQWMESQSEDVSLSIESASLDVESMEPILQTLRLPRRPQQRNDRPHRFFFHTQHLRDQHQAQLQAFTDQMQRQATESQALAAAQHAQAVAQHARIMRMVGGGQRVANDDDDNDNDEN